MTPVSGKTIWRGLVPAMVLPLLASLFYFVWFSENPVAPVIYFGTKLFTLAWPICIWIFLFGRRVSFRWPSRKDLKAVLSGLLVGSGMAAGLLLVLQTPLEEVLMRAAPAISRKASQLGFRDYYWAYAIFLSLFHSLLEEYYWRWFVFGRLREVMALPTALLLASLAFAAHHVVVCSQYFPFTWAILLGLFVAAGGAVWCLMLERQRSILGAWISHIIIDLAVMTVGYHVIV